MSFCLVEGNRREKKRKRKGMKENLKEIKKGKEIRRKEVD
jgi:hypothetical protein